MLTTASTAAFIISPVRPDYHMLNEQKKKGVAVLFIGEDLDVLKSISDRLMVIHDGEIIDIVDPTTVTKEDIGLMMVGDHINKGEEKAV